MIKYFYRGFEAEKILGATFETGKIFFSVKWKDCDHTDIVSASEANLRIPQLVIQFYEQRVDWGEEEEKVKPSEPTDLVNEINDKSLITS